MSDRREVALYMLVFALALVGATLHSIASTLGRTGGRSIEIVLVYWFELAIGAVDFAGHSFPSRSSM